MQFKSYEPVSNPVVVRMLEGDEKVGSIIIPSSARQQTGFGEVIFSKDDRFKVGTVLHVRQYSGADFELDGKMLTSVGLEEILGILS